MIALPVEMVRVPTWKQLLHSRWLFPLLLLIPLVALSALQLSGTSIGIYRHLAGIADPDLVAGELRPVRSDEWLVNTQMVIAQTEAGFPLINPNIADGQDMSLILDVPYKEWSIAFRPQNWPFFVLPLETAFALKWWLLLGGLLASAYAMVLHLLPGKRLMAALGAMTLGFNAFIFWWYQTITIAPLIWGIAAFLAARHLLLSQTRARRLGWAVALAYTATCFALVQYPPFQIPVLIVVAGLFIALLIEGSQLGKRRAATGMGLTIAACVVAGAIVGTFLMTRQDAVKTITSTVYPGQRTIQSGGVNPARFLAGFLAPELQNSDRAKHFPQNQSESSNFLPLMPFLAIPALAVMALTYRRQRQIDWPLMAVTLVTLLFMLRMFVPWPDAPYRLLLLDKVPNERIILSLGLLMLLQIVLLLRHVSSPGRSLPWMWAAFSSALALAAFGVVGWYLHRAYPEFLPDKAIIASLGAATAAALFLLLRQKTVALGLGTMVVLGVIASHGIQPLYRGLGPVTRSPLNQEIDRRGGTWVVADSWIYENIAVATGQDSLSGTQVYPQLNLWRQMDTSGNQSDVYNRYAHVTFTVAGSDSIELPGADHTNIRINPCGSFAQSRIDYILSTNELAGGCLTPEKRVQYGNQTFHIYAIP